MLLGILDLSLLSVLLREVDFELCMLLFIIPKQVHWNWYIGMKYTRGMQLMADVAGMEGFSKLIDNLLVLVVLMIVSNLILLITITIVSSDRTSEIF